MAYQRWFKTVRDQQGNAVNGASCTVYEVGTSTIATVYDPNSDDSSPSPLSNPFVTTSNGRFGFTALDGEYDVIIQGGSLATQSYRVTLNGGSLNTRSVLDFGAVGDGVTDDTAAIQSAINSGAGTVMTPKGKYSVLTLTLPSNVALVGEPGAWLIKQAGSVSDDNNAINIYGTVTATTSAATANVAGGDLAVEVTDGSLFAAGDWCLLRDNTWANAGVAGRNQQVVRVKSVATDTVNLYQAALGPYATADTAELVKIAPAENVTVDAVGIIVPTGTNTGGGISADLAVNLTLSGCEIVGPNDNPAMAIGRSYNVNIARNTWRDGQNLTGSGYAYGVSVGESSSFVRVIGNHQSNIRESSATNRARQVIFYGNTSDYSYDNHINTHGAWCDGVAISGNTCNGGGSGYTVGYSAHTRGDVNVTVANNTITNVNSHGVSVSAPSGKENQNVIVSNNLIYNPGVSTASSNGVRVSFATKCFVVGNMIDAASNTNTAYGVQIISSSGCVVSANTVSNITNGYGVAINAATNSSVIGNIMENISSNNVRCVGVNAGCRIFGNSADDTNVSIDTTTACDGNSWQTFSGSATYDPPSLADGAGATTTVTATGCALGDLASASFSLDTQGITITAWVSAANTVSVRFQNESGGPLDIASGTLKVQTRKLQGL